MTKSLGYVDLQNGYFLAPDGKVRPLEAVQALQRAMNGTFEEAIEMFDMDDFNTLQWS